MTISMYEQYAINFDGDIVKDSLPIKIIDSGSSGNSVFLSEFQLLIDLGLSYKRYPANFFNQVDYILLTHEHGDHINISTFIKLLTMYPHIRFIFTKRLAQKLLDPNFKRMSSNREKLLNFINTAPERFISFVPLTYTNRQGVSYALIPHHVKHGDISNVAIELICYGKDFQLLYATDLDNVEELPNKYFDTILLEANYSEDTLMDELKLNPYDVRALANLRHISDQVAARYVLSHIKKTGRFLPLHGSKEFGNLTRAVIEMNKTI